jgi:hypothetical protein
LELTGRADDGTWINTPLKIIRSTGDIIVSKNLAVSLNLVVSGNIYTVPWTDFSTTAITGWASYTTKHLRYKKVGSLVFVTFFIEGTSNSTSTHFTLPFRNNGLVHVSVPGQTRNSGFFDLGVTEVSSDSKTAVCYKLIGGGTWTASGIKRVAGQFFYHTNE